MLICFTLHTCTFPLAHRGLNCLPELNFEENLHADDQLGLRMLILSTWKVGAVLIIYDSRLSSNQHAACLLPQVAKEFGFNSNGFSIYLNRNKTGEILSQNKTLSLLKIK